MLPFPSSQRPCLGPLTPTHPPKPKITAPMQKSSWHSLRKGLTQTRGSQVPPTLELQVFVSSLVSAWN